MATPPIARMRSFTLLRETLSVNREANSCTELPPVEARSSRDRHVITVIDAGC